MCHLICLFTKKGPPLNAIIYAILEKACIKGGSYCEAIKSCKPLGKIRRGKQENNIAYKGACCYLPFIQMQPALPLFSSSNSLEFRRILEACLSETAVPGSDTDGLMAGGV